MTSALPSTNRYIMWEICKIKGIHYYKCNSGYASKANNLVREPTPMCSTFVVLTYWRTSFNSSDTSFSKCQSFSVIIPFELCPVFMSKNNKNAKTNLSKKHTLQLHEPGVQNCKVQLRTLDWQPWFEDKRVENRENRIMTGKGKYL